MFCRYIKIKTEKLEFLKHSSLVDELLRSVAKRQPFPCKDTGFNVVSKVFYCKVVFF